MILQDIICTTEHEHLYAIYIYIYRERERERDKVEPSYAPIEPSYD